MEKELKRKRVEITEGCQVHVGSCSTEDGKFEIIKFHKGFDHSLYTPSKRQFLIYNKNVRSIYKDTICKYARAYM